MADSLQSQKRGKCAGINKEYFMNEQEQYYERVQQLVAEMNTTACSVCGKQYKYKKAKINHEKKVHLIDQIDEQPVASNDPKEKVVDDRFNYAYTRLSLGMLLFNFDDAVKEGDGERVMRCWKFMMLIFKAYHHTKYSFAALQLQISTKALLTPRQAHSLIWNRMVNTKGGMGKNISMDLRLEQLDKLLKDMLRCLGANITQKSSERCSKALKLVEDILSSIDSELNMKTPKDTQTSDGNVAGFLSIWRKGYNRASRGQSPENLNESLAKRGYLRVMKAQSIKIDTLISRLQTSIQLVVSSFHRRHLALLSPVMILSEARTLHNMCVLPGDEKYKDDASTDSGGGEYSRRNVCKEKIGTSIRTLKECDREPR
ncbi:hypothetical protein AC249_AIPGENE19565, partial [Paramuricea clavata]